MSPPITNYQTTQQMKDSNYTYHSDTFCCTTGSSSHHPTEAHCSFIGQPRASSGTRPDPEFLSEEEKLDVRLAPLNFFFCGETISNK